MLVTLDLTTNSLRIAIDPPLSLCGRQPATLDLATRGRLLGLEVGERFITFDDRSEIDPALTRSVEVTVEIEEDGRHLTLPRAGTGWEIAFPSGNRCWIPRPGEGGALTCEVVIPGERPD